MKERPIVFNGDMVRAIMARRKTQTRRPINPQLDTLYQYVLSEDKQSAVCVSTISWKCVPLHGPGRSHVARCPFGKPGDLLWVKETFYKYYPREGWPAPKALYRADGITLELVDSEGKRQHWTPSIHMPRALSRITLEITDINIERVWNITNPEAIAEGAREINHVGDDPSHPTWTMGNGMERYDNPREAFAAAWDKIYSKRGLGWDANPWVWGVKFKRVEEVGR